MTFLAVAGGILLGLGTAALTIFNGGLIGAIFGLTIENGAVDELLRFVAPARPARADLHRRQRAWPGLRLGWAIVDPGPLTRGASLRRAARPPMEIVLGTMPWLVLAGLIEGFVSPRRLPLPAARPSASSSRAPYWALVLAGGRITSGPLVLARR